MNRLPLLFILLLLFACSESKPPENSVASLREAVRSDPGNADIRLKLAETYLELDEGELARTTLEQALDLGLDLDRAALPYAKALYVDKQFGELLAREVPPGVGAADHVEILYLQAEARSKLSAADVTNDAVVLGYTELLSAIDLRSADSGIAEVAGKLEAARTDREDIDRAWQHFKCSSEDIESMGWEPSERTGGRVLRVGPERQFTTISEVAREAQDGDLVEIDSGTYRGGVALWPQNNLVVRGVGDRPLITADGKSIQNRDVWLFTGDNVVVENVEISGARSPWENGAGIRHMGSGLTLRHVYLHNNENGLLTGNRHSDSNEVLIEYAEFANNGDNKGLAHNIYIGRAKRFELRYSYSHGSQGGHLVKSRAQENLITYNRLTDEEGGRSSYIIDIPEGGRTTVVGNVIEQGAETLNHGMISYAGESNAPHPENRLSIVNNSIYNRDFKGVVVRNHKDLDVVMANNLLGGAPAVTTDSVIELVNNLTRPEHGMVDPRNYDFDLVAGAPAIDAGVEFEIKPNREYVHPVRWRARQNVWQIDIGARERCGID